MRCSVRVSGRERCRGAGSIALAVHARRRGVRGVQSSRRAQGRGRIPRPQLVDGHGEPAASGRRSSRSTRCSASIRRPWAKRGYGEMFQVGEALDGQPLVDRQHPHDFVMQLAAVWRTPLGDDTGLTIAGGPSASRRSGRWRSCTAHRPRRIRSRRSSITRSIRLTSPSASSRRRRSRPVDGRGVAVQRPRARRAIGGTSTSGRSIPRRRGCGFSRPTRGCSRHRPGISSIRKNSSPATSSAPLCQHRG